LKIPVSVVQIRPRAPFFLLVFQYVKAGPFDPASAVLQTFCNRVAEHALELGNSHIGLNTGTRLIFIQHGGARALRMAGDRSD